MCVQIPQSASLTATADPGWSFAWWGGNCSGLSPGCSIGMGANRTVTALFRASALRDVAIVSPPAGDWVRGTVAVSATVGAGVGIARVE